MSSHDLLNAIEEIKEKLTDYEYKKIVETIPKPIYKYSALMIVMWGELGFDDDDEENDYSKAYKVTTRHLNWTIDLDVDEKYNIGDNIKIEHIINKDPISKIHYDMETEHNSIAGPDRHVEYNRDMTICFYVINEL